MRLHHTQLTHDYLVHSLRDWLTRKQRETRRGRAELRLAERSALWNAKPENRHLPSVLEWANIRVLTRRRDWTEAERRMMKRAGRFHGLRALGLAALASLLAAVGLNIRNRVVEGNQATAARGLVRQIVSADTAKVPEIIRAIKPSDRRWTDPELRQLGADAPENSKEKLHASLALLPVEPGQVEYLYRRLLSAKPGELPVIRRRSTITGQSWWIDFGPSWKTLKRARTSDSARRAPWPATSRERPKSGGYRLPASSPKHCLSR